MKNQRYDIIIAGAGAAGLSLLWYVLQSKKLKHSQILLIDQKLSPDKSKTWCFWEDHSFPLSNLIHHTWEILEVSANNKSFKEELKRYKYHCIRSRDYTSYILDIAKNHDRVTLLETSVKGFSYINESGVVDTQHGRFKAPWVFQSAVKSPDYDRSKVDISLMQHFLGWEIEVDHEIFDPEKVTFMDFDVPQKNGVTFMYILPFSKTNALLEHTLFSEKLLTVEEYENEIKLYIKNKFGLASGQYQINRIEKGAIPMEDRTYSSWYCNRVMNIGIMGGQTKPTTGYTFRRIHKRCREIVNALENGTSIPDQQLSTYRFRVYDMMMLHLLKNEPKNAVKVFSVLFQKNSFDRILQFLEENTGVMQEIAIFSKFSYMPFFRAMYKMKHRILTGA